MVDGKTTRRGDLVGSPQQVGQPWQAGQPFRRGECREMSTLTDTNQKYVSKK